VTAGREAAGSARLDRRAVVAGLLADRDDDLLVVAGLGSTAWDVTAAGDHDATFPLWGAMGGAAMVGLGLALAQPDKRVLVVTGDGEALMGLGSLATIGRLQPENLALVVIDNGHYGETGMQPTHTNRDGGRRTDLAAVAAACGWPVAVTVSSEAELGTAVEAARLFPGPVFVTVVVSTDPVPLVLPPRDGAQLAARFRRHLALPAL
jgi:thiamine pyrophosphate-dependent acetolactate synthase large subunit-like protein